MGTPGCCSSWVTALLNMLVSPLASSWLRVAAEAAMSVGLNAMPLGNWMAAGGEGLGGGAGEVVMGRLRVPPGGVSKPGGSVTPASSGGGEGLGAGEEGAPMAAACSSERRRCSCRPCAART